MQSTGTEPPIASANLEEESARWGAAGKPDARSILGVQVHATTYAAATNAVLSWAQHQRSRAIFAANVHMLMEAHDSPAFRHTLNRADLLTPDGMPLVWALRMLGVRGAERVYGPELTLRICAAARDRGVPIGLYGGTPEALQAFRAALLERFPGLEIAYSWSPPFRALAADETREVHRAIRASGARLLLVGLGCPKQEHWIHEQRGELPMPMLGVGAAFDFISGMKRQAPQAIQAIGLEWLFRLCAEPRRLWRRYLRHNPRFVLLLIRQLVARGVPPKGRADAPH